MTPQDDIKPGDYLGSYQIDGPAARGGMGAVFRARDVRLHRLVALKVLMSPAAGEPAHAQLLREARNAAALNHPNICTVYEVGEAKGRAFIAMEYVDGQPLSERIAGKALALTDALRFAREAADALSYAHAQGVIHRDLKPANAIVSASGRLKLVDFGLARRSDASVSPATTVASLISSGVALGTPYSMAPEQVRGGATDARTDVWALGVLLYEMLTGAWPFRGATQADLFSAILRDPPAPLPEAVPPALCALVAQCLEKLPDRRCRSANDVLAALTAADAAHGRSSSQTAAPVPGKTTVVVLPFQNLSSDPEQEYFSDGLTDDTISALGGISDGLRVVARTSCMAYKRTTKTAAQIGQELRADYLLESTVRREAQRVRIASRLIRVEDETQVWSEIYNRTPDSLLGVQDEISQVIAGAIEARLSLPRRALPSRPSTQNHEAYDLNLRGRYLSRHMAIREAIECYKAAAAKDPTYAAAYAGLAEAYAGLPIQADAEPLEYLEKARDAAARALQLDPNLAEAHAAAGWAQFFLGWEWVRAEQSLRRALELNPNHAMACFFLGHTLSNAYRHDEALALIRKGQDLDPLSPIMYSFHAQFLFDARRYAEALEPARRAITMAPAFFHGHEILSRLHLQRGALDEALVECEKSHELSGGMLFAVARTGYIHAIAGRRAEAEAVLARLGTIAAERFVAPSHLALVHAGLGDREQALTLLERAFELRSVPLALIPTDPVWDEYRQEPRFRALMKKYGFPERPPGVSN